MKNKTNSDALSILENSLIKDAPEVQELIARAREACNVAQQIYDMRTRRGLTQSQLAALVGTTPSAICRLEDADYAGHSLKMLRRIADKLQFDMRISFKDRLKEKATLEKKIRTKAASAGNSI